MKVIAYARVSTDTQVEDGSSLAAQRVRLQAYATALGLQIVEIIEDAGYSAKSLERPGIKRACEFLERGEADGILVVRLDRLTRSIKDLWWLLERYFIDRPTVRDCTLFSVTDSIDTRTASGRLVLNIIAIISQWEREIISERVRETLAHLKSQGIELGHSTARDRSPTVDLIRGMQKGGASIRKISAELNAAGVPSYFGKKWHPTTVARLLRST